MSDRGTSLARAKTRGAHAPRLSFAPGPRATAVGTTNAPPSGDALRGSTVPHPSFRTTARLRLCAVCVGRARQNGGGTMGRVTADGSRAQGSLNALRLIQARGRSTSTFCCRCGFGRVECPASKNRRANDTRPARGILRQGSIPHRIRFCRMRSTKMPSVKRRSVRKTHSLADQVTRRRRRSGEKPTEKRRRPEHADRHANPLRSSVRQRGGSTRAPGSSRPGRASSCAESRFGGSTRDDHGELVRVRPSDGRFSKRCRRGRVESDSTRRNVTRETGRTRRHVDKAFSHTAGPAVRERRT